MKKTLLLLALVAITALSCKKDPIDPPDPPDPCDAIVCYHGGTCVNGLCDCPSQWTGPSCEQEVAPIKMKVTKINLTGFPLTDTGGAGWDLFDGADVYLEILKDNVSLYKTGYVENLTTQYEWTVNFEFSNPTATYVIRAYDYDFGLTSDDNMGGISFTPYRPGQKFPTSYSLGGCSGCVVFFDFNGISYFH